MAKVLMKGNEAVAEAAVRGGCRFFAGYPITPQSEIPEYLSGRLPEVGGVFVQGESEVASINMVYGAASSGVRAMTGGHCKRHPWRPRPGQHPAGTAGLPAGHQGPWPRRL